MKLSLVPLRTQVGDLLGNSEKILKLATQEEKRGSELVVFPELALTGYPPQDLLLSAWFIKKAQSQVEQLNASLAKLKCAVIYGAVIQKQDKLLNAAVCVQGDRIVYSFKSLIPSYDVFNENRYFHSGLEIDEAPKPIKIGKFAVGILVCEDSWPETKIAGRVLYHSDPSLELKKQSADILINISASPFSTSKIQERLKVLSAAAKKTELPLYYVNHLGAQDELIFAGETYAFTAKGELSHTQDAFAGNAMQIVLGEKIKNTLEMTIANSQKLEAQRQAIVCGIKDYAQKNRFTKAVLGISGGIDSALVACLAAEALGPENVIGLSLPSKFSSSHSIEDAEQLAKNIGLTYRNFPIKFVHSTLLMGIKPYFQNLPEDVTEENLQARLRGITVMAFANKFRALALATGNKSEFAVGYSTLYGDSCGALAPIGDLYKTEVYELAKFINKFQEVIPVNTINKAPSAELRPNQKDQDSLPPYPVLDAILFELVEKGASLEEAEKSLAASEHKVTAKLIDEIAHKLTTAEFKRRQSPPILKLSDKAFGIGRRYPITGHIF